MLILVQSLKPTLLAMKLSPLSLLSSSVVEKVASRKIPLTRLKSTITFALQDSIDEDQTPAPPRTPTVHSLTAVHARRSTREMGTWVIASPKDGDGAPHLPDNANDRRRSRGASRISRAVSHAGTPLGGPGSSLGLSHHPLHDRTKSSALRSVILRDELITEKSLLNSVHGLDATTIDEHVEIEAPGPLPPPAAFPFFRTGSLHESGNPSESVRTRGFSVAPGIVPDLEISFTPPPQAPLTLLQRGSAPGGTPQRPMYRPEEAQQQPKSVPGGRSAVKSPQPGSAVSPSFPHAMREPPSRRTSGAERASEASGAGQAEGHVAVAAVGLIPMSSPSGCGFFTLCFGRRGPSQGARVHAA